MLVKIPQDVSPDMAVFCQRVNDLFDILLGGRNVDFRGRRIINAGDARADQDYITRAQVVRIVIAGGGKVNPDGSAIGSGSAPSGSSSSGSGSGSISPAAQLASDLMRVSLRA